VSMAAWPAQTGGGAGAPAPSPSASPSLCCSDNVRCRRHRDADPQPQVRARAAPLAPRVGAGGEAPLKPGGGRSRGGRAKLLSLPGDGMQATRGGAFTGGDAECRHREVARCAVRW
jgi:hypothetical protein